MKKTIILGNTGFVGESLEKSLVSSNAKNKIRGFSTKELNLENQDCVNHLTRLDIENSCVIVLAGVKKQLGDNLNNYIKNNKIAENLVRVFQKKIPQKLIYISSLSVYGEDVLRLAPVEENDLVNPQSYYGISKFSTERLLLKTFCTFNSDEKILILRPPLIYGNGDRSQGYGPTGFVHKALRDEIITLWGDGSEKREFVYISDVIKIIKKAMLSKAFGVLNLVSGKSYSFQNVIEIIEKEIGKSLNIERRQRSKIQVDHHFKSSVERFFPNFSFLSLEKGIQATLNEIQN